MLIILLGFQSLALIALAVALVYNIKARHHIDQIDQRIAEIRQAIDAMDRAAQRYAAQR